MNGAPVWEAVWSEVADAVGNHVDRGLGHLVTEDVVRFATVQALVGHGVGPTRLECEWRRPGVTDAVDLVVLSDAAPAVNGQRMSTERPR